MAKHFRIFLIFAILLFTLFSIKFYQESHELENLKQQIVEDETKSLTALFKSFRKVYQQKFIENHIIIDDKTVELLPVRTTSSISQEFSSLIGDRATIRTVSDRPRNHANKANPQEMKILNYFKDNKSSGSYFNPIGNGEYYYAEPLYIQKTCLKCHGKRENAVDLIKKRYDTAYDYELGDLRGIISIKISKQEIIDKLDTNYAINVQTSIVVFLLFMLAVYLLIKIIMKNEEQYSNMLENRVSEQFNEIQNKNDILFQQSKMAVMGEMIGNIAHQWRQPLSSISTAASGMKIQKEFGKLSDKDFDESIENIVDSTQHLSNTIDDFRNFFKESKEKDEFNVAGSVHNSLKLVDSNFKLNQIRVVLDLQDDIEVIGYERELMQAILNILNNANDALVENQNDDDRLVMIKLYSDEAFAKIEIIDSAGGIPQKIIDKIFEPYFTTKGAVKGTGIGLYMTRQIVIEHMDGDIKVENKTFSIKNHEYSGAKFSILLPLKKD